MAQICPLQANHTTQIHPLQASQQLLFECLLSPYVYKGGLSPKPESLIKPNLTVQQLMNKNRLYQMTTHSNYSLQNFSTNLTRDLTKNLDGRRLTEAPTYIYPISESMGLNCHFDRNFMGNLLTFFKFSKSFQLITTLLYVSY